MRMPGIAEIILIIVVASIVLIAIRLIGTPARRRSQRLARERAADEEDDEETIRRTRRSRIQLAGVIAIVLDYRSDIKLRSSQVGRVGFRRGSCHRCYRRRRHLRRQA